MNKPKIFIIENDITPIKLIHWSYESIFNKPNTNEYIFPKIPNILENEQHIDFTTITEKFKDLSNKSEEEKESILEKIYQLFPSTNFYIIDKELISKTRDSFGIEFFKFLIQKKNINPNQCFFISDYDPETFNIDIDKYYFEDKKIAEFEDRLLNKIKNIWGNN